MLFNSFNFAIFLIVVFILYWFVTSKSLKAQNILLLLSSYFFYACWNWHFVFLLIFSTFLDYFTGLKIYESKSKALKKMWLIISVGVNVGFLGFFKYYNFFANSFADLLGVFHLHFSVQTINVLLPVGISFYTFHGLSYVFDIYNDKTTPTTDFIGYSLFVSFFPLLVAGPIERATHLLPQVQKPRKFNYLQATDGLRQILWGLFKKVVIADNCASYANTIFNNYHSYSGSTLVLGALMFTFQIYGDFSGYSDMALGTAKLFGFDLLKNFSFPYFSRSIAEFWRRWHISLSSWFRDYLYFPLGGSRGGKSMVVRNTFIIFLVSGFWHGANWTFIAWGFLNALYIMPSVFFKTNRTHLDIVAQGKLFPTFRELLQMCVTFSLCVFAWIFFRSDSISMAFDYIKHIFSTDLLHKPKIIPYTLIILIPLFMALEWLGRENNYALENLCLKWSRPLRWGFYSVIIFAIGMYMQTSLTQFIYFQF